MNLRVILLFIIVLACSTIPFKGVALTATSDSKSEILSKLPEKAKSFVAHHFVSYHFENCKKRKQMYRLNFSSLGYIEFSPKGEWTMIDGVAMQLPSSLFDELPNSVVDYMESKHAYSGLKTLARDDTSYTVRFIYPDITIQFDLEGNLISEVNNKAIANNCISVK